MYFVVQNLVVSIVFVELCSRQKEEGGGRVRRYESEFNTLAFLWQFVVFHCWPKRCRNSQNCKKSIFILAKGPLSLWGRTQNCNELHTDQTALQNWLHLHGPKVHSSYCPMIPQGRAHGPMIPNGSYRNLDQLQQGSVSLLWSYCPCFLLWYSMVFYISHIVP